MSNYIIGIDLGTTNCTLAYTQGDDAHSIHQFSIPQITNAGTVGEDPSLPSFLYFPLQEELSAGHVNLEGFSSSNCCVGLYARNRGAELPIRLISSAKSWLCHLAIDRRNPLLPLEFEETSSKMSPLQACAELLRHMRFSWENKMPHAPFKDQQILIRYLPLLILAPDNLS